MTTKILTAVISAAIVFGSLSAPAFAEKKLTRSTQAKSNIASTHDKTADALVQNIRG